MERSEEFRGIASSPSAFGFFPVLACASMSDRASSSLPASPRKKGSQNVSSGGRSTSISEPVERPTRSRGKKCYNKRFRRGPGPREKIQNLYSQNGRQNSLTILSLARSLAWPSSFALLLGCPSIEVTFFFPSSRSSHSSTRQ